MQVFAYEPAGWQTAQLAANGNQNDEKGGEEGNNTVIDCCVDSNHERKKCKSNQPIASCSKIYIIHRYINYTRLQP